MLKIETLHVSLVPRRASGRSAELFMFSGKSIPSCTKPKGNGEYTESELEQLNEK